MKKTFYKLKMLYKLASRGRGPKIFSFHDCLPDVFSSYVELLISKRYRLLGGQELLDRLSLGAHFKGATPSTSHEAALTFDDGRRNCWTVVFPLLKKYKIKASFFIIPSRVRETEEYLPNLEDYWKGKVSWECLYMSHRKQPYLTWRELETMKASGLVDIYSHSLKHNVVSVGSHVIDFQHPGVYEMPVYFDEWFLGGEVHPDTLWGAPVYERSWSALASNCYVSDKRADVVMNEFVNKNGGFLFFKKKDWRKKLFEYFFTKKKSFPLGHFKKIENKEDLALSISESKKKIEDRLKNTCAFFSLPLYQSTPLAMRFLRDSGYKAVFSGPGPYKVSSENLPVISRIPSFWIKFISYL